MAGRGTGIGEPFGVAIAIVSSRLGGTAAAVTRCLVGSADPLTLAILRWRIGFLCVLPVALVMYVRWPKTQRMAGGRRIGHWLLCTVFRALRRCGQLRDAIVISFSSDAAVRVERETRNQAHTVPEPDGRRTQSAGR